ncbi:MAG: hypothetical protein Pg6A_19930 [Termitinemataceae bacterium]|nr:MAG: hypothetical protein Pg6A_19930 [Termitinemataceae bacterium]
MLSHEELEKFDRAMRRTRNIVYIISAIAMVVLAFTIYSVL